jgi:hypothetical protein
MAKSKRTGLKANDLVTLRFASIPAYGGKPFVSKFDTVLRVQSVTGTGTMRNPWQATVTDDAGHTWILQPGDLMLAESLAVRRGDPLGIESRDEPAKRHHHVTKSPAQIQRDIDEELAAATVAKARTKATQSNRRQTIWLTREGEFRIRPMFEKVSPLWSFVRHVPSDDELRS